MSERKKLFCAIGHGALGIICLVITTQVYAMERRAIDEVTDGMQQLAIWGEGDWDYCQKSSDLPWQKSARPMEICSSTDADDGKETCAAIEQGYLVVTNDYLQVQLVDAVLSGDTGAILGLVSQGADPFFILPVTNDAGEQKIRSALKISCEIARDGAADSLDAFLRLGVASQEPRGIGISKKVDPSLLAEAALGDDDWVIMDERCKLLYQQEAS